MILTMKSTKYWYQFSVICPCAALGLEITNTIPLNYSLCVLCGVAAYWWIHSMRYMELQDSKMDNLISLSKQLLKQSQDE